MPVPRGSAVIAFLYSSGITILYKSPVGVPYGAESTHHEYRE